MSWISPIFAPIVVSSISTSMVVVSSSSSAIIIIAMPVVNNWNWFLGQCAKLHKTGIRVRVPILELTLKVFN